MNPSGIYSSRLAARTRKDHLHFHTPWLTTEFLIPFNLVHAVRYLLAIIILPLLFGCSLERIAVRSSISILDRGVEAMEEEPDIELAREAMAANLKMMEGLIKADPENDHLSLLAAKGFGSYAFSFVEGENPARAREFYKRGRDYGLKILLKEAKFRNALKGNMDQFKQSLSAFGKEDAPALFWTGYNWGQWLNLSKDSPAAIIEMPKIEILMKYLLELEEGYYFGGPHLFFGVYYAGKPIMFGGDPKRAKKHFERALELSGENFLMIQYMYAKTYAVQVQDRKLFEKLLQGVLDKPADTLPAQRLANEVAKSHAKKLLTRADEFF